MVKINMVTRITFFATILMLLLTLSGSLLGPLTVSASVGILPEGTDIRDENDRGWFVYSLAPGEVQSDIVVLTNSSNEDIVVELKGRDSEITSDGAFTVISNELSNKMAGQWIKLSEERYAIPAASSIEVPFTVEVPQSTPAGEYGAGLAVQQIGDGSGERSGNVVIKTRNAVRMYVAVEGDLSLGAEVENLNIIDPADENFAIERSKRSTLGRDNLIVQFQAQNTGNIYGTLNSDYVITFPDGNTIEGSLKRDLAPDTPIKEFYIETKQPFLAGETTVDFNYNIEPLNVQGEYSELNMSGSLQDVLRITQEEIDTFAPARNPIVVTQAATDNPKGAISEEPEVIEDTEENGLRDTLLITAIIFLALILLLQIINFARNSKSNKKKDKEG